MSFSGDAYLTDSEEEILDGMVATADQYWDEDLTDDDLAAMRIFYRPIAEFFVELQEDLAAVLQSTQIDNAEDARLDLLTALIGVVREPATRAEGTATFSRDEAANKDYTIPEGTIAQTDSNDPTEYRTTDVVTLASGTTSVDIPIESVNTGADTNTAADTIIVLPNPPAGVENVTNAAQVTGGTNRETDDALRARAKDELAKGARASAPALINSILGTEGVKDTVIHINDTNTDNTGSGGLPDHSFELVVEGGADSDVAQTIMNTKAAGDTSYAGAHGSSASATTILPNGQEFTIEFSRPTTTKIYVDAEYDVDDSYVGDDEVRDNIVEYIGGVLSEGVDEEGRLDVGSDVLIGEVEYAIRGTQGVYDVTSLAIDTSSSPTATSNITIADSERAEVDATDGSVTLNTTQV